MSKFTKQSLEDQLDYAELVISAAEEHIDIVEAELRKYQERVQELEKALFDIANTGKGRGAAVVVTTDTLRYIAKRALEGDK